MRTKHAQCKKISRMTRIGVQDVSLDRGIWGSERLLDVFPTLKVNAGTIQQDH